MKVWKIVGVGLAVVALGALAFYVWASIAASRKLSRTYVTHMVEFATPTPGREPDVQRGKHLVESRYACGECHGTTYGGGVMIDDPAIGRVLGPNLTGGSGTRTAGYRPADWDRIVRHGVKPDGTPALMPSGDFRRMSDQELADIVVFLQSQPPVNHEVPAPTLGPVGKVLVATGKFALSAASLESHGTAHAATPPETEPTVAFGRHVATTCTGCHGENLGGGPIVGGDPSWPPAANLTPHPTGLGGWTFAQFGTAMRAGKRPDGTALRAPMSNVAAYARKLTDVEMEGLWNYLRSVPGVASGG